MTDFTVQLEDGGTVVFRSSAIAKVHLKHLEAGETDPRNPVDDQWGVVIDGHRVFTGDREKAEGVMTAVVGASGLLPRSLGDLVAPGTLP